MSIFVRFLISISEQTGAIRLHGKHRLDKIMIRDSAFSYFGFLRPVLLVELMCVYTKRFASRTKLH